MADSIADEYFAKFTGPGAAALLSGLPDGPEKTFEDNWLDFKSGKPGDDHKIREIWSKGVGAMANAGGGVIVWGMIAKKHGEPPIDAVERIELVENVEAFASKLIDAQHFITDPPLSFCKVKAIPLAPGGKEGFVVCLIPEGATKPYQSLKAKKPFYIRFGDESKEPPLSILRQLFNPQYNPRIQIKVAPNISTSWKDMCEMNLTLANVGDTTLRNGELKVECQSLGIRQIRAVEAGEVPSKEAGPALLSIPDRVHPSKELSYRLFTAKPQPQHRTIIGFTLYALNMRARFASVVFLGRRTDHLNAEFQ